MKKFEASGSGAKEASTSSKKSGSGKEAFGEFWEAPSRFWRPKVRELEEAEMDAISVSTFLVHVGTGSNHHIERRCLVTLTQYLIESHNQTTLMTDVVESVIILYQYTALVLLRVSEQVLLDLLLGHDPPDALQALLLVLARGHDPHLDLPRLVVRRVHRRHRLNRHLHYHQRLEKHK